MIFRCCLHGFFPLILSLSIVTSPLAAASPAPDDDSESAESTSAAEESDSTPVSNLAATPLIGSTGKSTTFGEAFGEGYKVILFTKPWSDTNAQLIGELSHFRMRLNRGQLKSGVIFLRSDLAAASRIMTDFKGRVRYLLDPDGRAARLLTVKTIPALMLIDPDGRVRYSTPLLAQDLVRQVAAHYHTPDKLFGSPRPSGPPRRPGIPPAKGNSGQFSVR